MALTEWDGTAGPATASHYYTTDHLATVRALHDDTGAITAEYTHSAYCKPETRVETVSQPLGFNARYYDAATGLYHYHFRDYDPDTGTFIQEDPIFFAASDLNTRRYVWNNPVRGFHRRWKHRDGFGTSNFGAS